MERKQITKLEESIKNYKINENTNLIENELGGSSCIVLEKQDVGTIFSDLHSHDFYEVLYNLEGRIIFSIDGHPVILNPGDIIIISPTTLHRLEKIIDDKSKRVVLKFTKKYANKFSTQNSNLLHAFELSIIKQKYFISLDSHTRKKIENYFNNMLELNFSKEYGDDLFFNNRFVQVMLIINVAYLHSQENEEINQSHHLISKISDYIKNNIENKITLQQIADEFYLSISRICHLFKEETGLPLMKYVMKKRLLHAKELIRNGIKISHVYSLCGFQDNTSFFRAFKKEFNLTPKMYLSNIQNM